MYWKSEYSPDAPTSVVSPTRRMRRSSVKRASEPYEPARWATAQTAHVGMALALDSICTPLSYAPSVSAASMTPSLYLIASTEVPVTMGCL